MNFIGTNPIDLKRLYLRPFKLGDLNDVFDYANNENVTRYLTWNSHKNLAETYNFLLKTATIYDDKTFRWAIVLKQNNKVIGSIDVTRIEEENSVAEIGYVLNETYHNQGYMSEAFKGVIDYLFNKVQFKKIVACYQLENIASKRVMEKCGLKPLNLIEEKNIAIKR